MRAGSSLNQCLLGKEGSCLQKIKRLKLDSSLYTKIKDLNVRPETIKLSGEYRWKAP